MVGDSKRHVHAQVMKNAFAMRSNLGDPGVCKPGDVPGSADNQCFQDLSDLLTAMLSPAYADTLKCVTETASGLLPSMKTTQHKSNGRLHKGCYYEGEPGKW